VEDRKQRVEAALSLEDGQPLVWGPDDQRRGIRIDNGIPSIVHLGADDDPVAKGIAVHHERHESPAYAFALASLQRPHFPLPIGVFRAVEKPSYDRLLDDQVEAAIAKKGKGDLEKLLNSGDTWTVSD
jgi:2-oxoglutarate ferredoxin oxidoreductase subunit beta